MPEVARKQPMYLVQKGNEKYNAEEENQFLVLEKSSKNILQLIEKTIELMLSAKSEALTLAVKQELM